MADRSGRINGKLQSRRDHIDELNAVRILLVKLQVRGLAGRFLCFKLCCKDSCATQGAEWLGMSKLA